MGHDPERDARSGHAAATQSGGAATQPRRHEMTREWWNADLLPEDEDDALASYPDVRDFERRVEDARAQLRASLARRDPMPDIDPPLIEERSQRSLAARRW
jgi:hypothetical protein